MATDPYGFPILGGWLEIDAAGMAEVDLLMVETYGITLPQVMENAGRSLAILARDRFFDGLIGYSLHGSPRGRALDLIRWANASSAPVLAVDVPSGFDSQAGTGMAEVNRTTAALALAFPKRGLASPSVRNAVVEPYLADNSVPPGLYERLTTPRVVPPFAVADILHLPTRKDFTNGS